MASSETKIEWTDSVWNPVRGCSRVSEGCTRCYAEAIAARFSGPGLAYEGFAKRTKGGPRWTGKVQLVREALDQPLRWRKPRRIFVNSMSDLFHESLADEEIAAIFGVMASAPQHTFQVLTKRADRMRRWFDWVSATGPSCHPLGAARGVRWFAWDRQIEGCSASWSGPAMPDWRWPLPNVWIGVSVENQAAADERIPLLLDTPAAVRFLSCEPLLGRLSIKDWLPLPLAPGNVWADCLCAEIDPKDAPCVVCVAKSGVDWVIVGGESGPRARPCAEEWIQSVMAQCRESRVPCFVKQMGAYVVSEHRTAPAEMMSRPEQLEPTDYAPNGEVWAWRAGLTDKKGADPEQFRELSTREFPEVRHA